MARYIDADSLYRRVKTHTNPYGKPALDYKSGVKVLDMINQEPTADVVPKSEVARDFDDLKRYIILNENIAIKCKRENGEQNEEYWKGKISAFKQIRAYIDAELKKKYTEGEK